MNKFSEQLLQAFEVAMDEKISRLQYDKTVQATVTKVEDVDTGEYKVKYQDGIMSAFASDLTEEFKEGDVVYVTVPEGDFNNKKFISHKLTNNSLSAGQYNQLADTIIDISPEFQNLGFTYKIEPANGFGLIVGASEPDEIDILDPQSQTTSSEFLTFANNYEYVQIGASFKTEFIKDPAHNKGDYGICVIFRNTSGQDVPYFLSVNYFNGDPYHLYTWSPQTIVVKLPKGQITGLSAIKFYEKDFDQDSSDTTNPNLFMKDLSLSFVEHVDLTEIPYYLSILPHEGITFTDTTTTIHLEGKIIHYGEEIKPDSCIYKWFERDLSVLPGTEDYDKRVGWGWKFLEDEVAKELIVSKEQVNGTKKFKLLAVYNSSTIMTQEVELTNSTSDFNVTIEQVSENGAVSLQLSDMINYTGDWYYLTSEGQSPLSGYPTPGPIDVTALLLYSPMSFYCSVYDSDGDYQGELYYVMQNMESKEDVSVVFTGETIFSYDANGDINILDAENERALAADIVFNKGVISSACTITWLDYAGNIIDSEGKDYSNDSSMMFKSIRVDTSKNILYYTIKHRFRQVPSKNNTLKVQISTIDGQVYSFDKEIIFTKTGDPGTNGTKYQVLITRNYELLKARRATTLTCNIYKDGDLYTGEAKYAWELHGVSLNSGSSLTGNPISVIASGSDTKRYAKVEVKTGETTIYCFTSLPIATANVSDTTDLSMLPKYVQYGSNGRNPQYLRNPISEMPFSVAPTSNVSILGDYLRFADKFDPDNNIALLTLTVTNGTIYYPIPLYMNTYGNEDINGWDGVELKIDNSGRYIYSPQVGAGTKDNSNRFTGVVMGEDSQQSKIGLYGYSAGVNTFGLMENGVAYFGKSGSGQITINGTKAEIRGGPDGGSSASGMTINLYGSQASDSAIKVGAGNFSVNYGGILRATGATISGTLTAGAGSKIGSWNLTDTRLYSGSGSTYVALDSGTADVNEAIWAGSGTSTSAPFRVTRAGVLNATNATIRGVIQAKTGQIGCGNDGTGGWTINTNKIFGSKTYNNAAKYAGISVQGDYAFYAGSDDTNDSGDSGKPANAPFSVKFDGTLKATDATITGTITANSGSIGGSSKGWTIDTGKLKSGSGTTYIEINSDSDNDYAIWAGNSTASSAPFSVTKKGALKATSATVRGSIQAKTGRIGCGDDGTGGWSINTNRIYGSKIYDDVEKFAAISTQGNYAFFAGATGVNDNGDANSRPSQAPFSVKFNGDLKATSATIAGAITATSGTIGNWKINSKDDKRLRSTGSGLDTRIYLDGGATGTDKAIFVSYNASPVEDTSTYDTSANGYFYVTANGKMYAQAAEIRGIIKSKSGEIGGWTIASDSLSKNNMYIKSSGAIYSNKHSTFESEANGFYLSGSGLSIGKNFSVTSTGQITAKTGSFGGSLSAATGTFAGSLSAATGTFAGSLSAATGTFAGSLSAATGTFAGSLSAATGTFAGNLSAAGGTFAGSLSAATGTFKGKLSAATGTFAGDLSAAGGTFAGDLSAAGGTFAGSLSAATGTFAGDLSAAGGTFSGNLNAAGGTFTGSLSAASGTFNGTVNAGTVTIANGSIYSSNHTSYNSSEEGFYLGSSGVSIGSGFRATSSGNLTVGWINAQGGQIGGCQIVNGQLQVPSNNIVGNIVATSLRIGNSTISQISTLYYNTNSVKVKGENDSVFTLTYVSSVTPYNGMNYIGLYAGGQ